MKEKHRKEVGQRLREFRLEMNMTQEQMLQYSDIGRSNFSRIEAGKIFPNLSLLQTLQDKFDLNINWLICNNGEMFIRNSLSESFKFEKNKEEVNELLHHMSKVTALKHAVLSFFFEYKERNKKLFK
jgi:transcriptional regulator with XRE-family HTH domain